MKRSAKVMLAAVVLASLVLAGCGGSSNKTATTPPTPTLGSISITPSSALLAAGLTKQFTATGTYSDNSTKDLTTSVTWSSSDTNLATISSGGLATTKAQGTVTITAASGGISNRVTVTVTAPQLMSLSVSAGTTSLATGLTQQVTANGTYSDNSTTDLTTSVTWSSSNTVLASVSSSGMVTASGAGTVTITATSGSITGSITLTITGPALRTINVIPGTASVAKGESQQFAAYGVYTDNSQQDLTALVTWSSSNTGIVTVTGGLAQGLATGSASIRAASGAITGSATLQVTAATLSSLSLSPSQPTVAAGGFQQFTATGLFSDGSSQDMSSGVAWASDNTAVATVSTTGLASGLTAGTANISGCVGAICDTTQLTVTPATLVSIAVTPTSASIASGTTQQFTAVATFSDGSTDDITAAAAWTSSAPTVASIDASGLATGNSTGTGVVITATSGAVSATASLDVTAVVLSSIAVTPAMPSIGLNATEQFTATGIFSDGTAQDMTSLVVWTSSDSSVATISNTGLASAVSRGTSEIRATSGSMTGSTTLTVTDANLTGIIVNTSATSSAPPATVPLILGQHQRVRLYAWGTYGDGTTRPLSGVTWTTSAPPVAAVTNTGVVISKNRAGTATITASLAGVSGTLRVKVTTAALESVSITPASATIAPGTTQQFVLTGTFTDGSTEDLTALAYWQTSSASVATISKGLAKAVSTGTATISATYGGLSAVPATLTVTDATVQSITIDPSSPAIVLGAAEQFTATGTFSDGTQQDLTLLVRWSSSNAGVAIISNSGLATSAGRGTTNIGATFQSATNTTVLTVN